MAGCRLSTAADHLARMLWGAPVCWQLLLCRVDVHGCAAQAQLLLKREVRGLQEAVLAMAAGDAPAGTWPMLQVTVLNQGRVVKCREQHAVGWV